jgi:hypothetical protein
MTAWTITPWPAKIALSDCVMFNAAAFEMEYAGITGKAASATNERLLTIAPLECVSSGRKARDILSGRGHFGQDKFKEHKWEIPRRTARLPARRERTTDRGDATPPGDGSIQSSPLIILNYRT